MRPNQQNRYKAKAAMVERLTRWAPGHLRSRNPDGFWVPAFGITERNDSDRMLTAAVSAMPEELRWLIFAHYLMGWTATQCREQSGLGQAQYEAITNDAHIWLTGYLAAMEEGESECGSSD